MKSQFSKEAKMPAKQKEVFLLAVLGLLVAGCSSTQTYQARSYVDDKERVDQKMEGGNHGYIFGTPKAEDRSQLKKTRQVVVVEFSKEDEAAQAAITPAPRKPRTEKPATPIDVKTPTPTPRRSVAQPIALPNFDEEKPPASVAAPVEKAGGYTNYVVEKGDTLQKISKKFYGTYRRWNEIFEANNDVLKDPNKLKPGMTLRIPGGGAAAPTENLK